MGMDRKAADNQFFTFPPSPNRRCKPAGLQLVFSVCEFFQYPIETGYDFSMPLLGFFRIATPFFTQFPMSFFILLQYPVLQA